MYNKRFDLTANHHQCHIQNKLTTVKLRHSTLHTKTLPCLSLTVVTQTCSLCYWKKFILEQWCDILLDLAQVYFLKFKIRQSHIH